MRTYAIFGMALAIWLCVLSAAHTQVTAGTTVTIQVRDQTGVAIQHANVELVPRPDSLPNKMETDANGCLALHLAAGSYRVAILAPGFKKRFQYLDVAADQKSKDATQILPITIYVADIGDTVYASDSLMLSADAYHAPIALSPAEFRALPHVTVTVHNGHSNADETYSGVLLATLLAKVDAPAGKELRGAAMANYVVATGSDGYGVVLAVAEVMPGFQEGQVLVADTKNGQPLGDYGPFQLIVSNDKRPARWVRNLNSISLRSAR
jgi:hypothetical protein